MISTRSLGLVLAALSLAACQGGATIGAAPGPISTSAGPSPMASASASMAASPGPGTSTSPSPGASASASPGGGASPAVTPTATASPVVGSSPSAAASPSGSPSGGGTPAATPTASVAPSPGSSPQTTGEKVYVVNHGQLGDNPSVTVYPLAATGTATPIATIAGPNTLLAQPFFDAVDASGTLYVSNQSNTPGSSNAGYVTEYAATVSGNVAPTRTITGLFNPTGLALDAAGNLYVAVVDAIDVFAPGASGNAMPIRVIGGRATTLQNLVVGGQPYGVAVDSAGNAFTAMGTAVLEFPPAATGNVAPSNVYGGVNKSNPSTTGPPYGSPVLSSCLGVAVDAADDVYCANFNNSTFALFTSPTAGATIPSTGASMPFGIYVDSTGQVFATNFKSSTVQVFSSMATFATGVATTTIAGMGTGLNFPYGVTAR